MNILLIEDSVDYAETLKDLFSEGDGYYIRWVEKLEDVKIALYSEKWDVILSDIHLSFLPSSFLKFYYDSEKNSETPLIFLTAERETILANDLQEMGDFPILSKHDVDSVILEVVQSYTELYSKIKSHGKLDTQISFKRYLADYISRKKFLANDLKKSIAEWLEQESKLFTKLSERLITVSSSGSPSNSEFNSGFMRVKAETFQITMASYSFKIFTNNTKPIESQRLDHFLSNIVPVEKLMFILNKMRSENHLEVIVIDLLGLKKWKKNKFIASVQLIVDEYSSEKYFEIQISNKSAETDSNQLVIYDQLNQVLREEIHHRVNNNLSLINGLLNLRMMNLDSEEAKIYASILRQIYPISIVYKILNRTENITDVYLKDYLEKLLNENSYTDGLDIPKNKILIKERDLKLSINQIVPLGLVLNEILELLDKNTSDIELYVEQNFDAIDILIRGGRVGGIIANHTGEDSLILNTLLNDLGALVSTKCENEALIRFKVSNKKGSSSNI